MKKAYITPTLSAMHIAPATMLAASTANAKLNSHWGDTVDDADNIGWSKSYQGGGFLSDDEENDY